MSEKTPRQIGTEAEALYAEHKDVAPELEWANETVESRTSQVQHFHNKANALEQGIEVPELDLTPEEDAQRRRKMRDDVMESLGKSIMKQGELIQKSDANLDKAAAHYKQNATGYYKLGVHEAALDGVHINVQQPKNVEEHTEADQN